MTNPIQTLVIPVDGEGRVEEIAQDLATHQALVGGYIEEVSGGPGVTFWCTEDAKGLGLTVNKVATAMWWELNPVMRHRDVLCGPVFVTGGPDGRGASNPVPSEVVQLYQQTAKVTA